MKHTKYDILQFILYFRVFLRSLPPALGISLFLLLTWFEQPSYRLPSKELLQLIDTIQKQADEIKYLQYEERFDVKTPPYFNTLEEAEDYSRSDLMKPVWDGTYTPSKVDNYKETLDLISKLIDHNARQLYKGSTKPDSHRYAFKILGRKSFLLHIYDKQGMIESRIIRDGVDAMMYYTHPRTGRTVPELLMVNASNTTRVMNDLFSIEKLLEDLNEYEWMSIPMSNHETAWIGFGIPGYFAEKLRFEIHIKNHDGWLVPMYVNTSSQTIPSPKATPNKQAKVERREVLFRNFKKLRDNIYVGDKYQILNWHKFNNLPMIQFIRNVIVTNIDSKNILDKSDIDVLFPANTKIDNLSYINYDRKVLSKELLFSELLSNKHN